MDKEAAEKKKSYVLTKGKVLRTSVLLVLSSMIVLALALFYILSMRIIILIAANVDHLHTAVMTADYSTEIFTENQRSRLSTRVEFVDHLSSVLEISDEEAVKLAEEQYGIDKIVLLDQDLNLIYPEEPSIDIKEIRQFIMDSSQDPNGMYSVAGDYGYQKKTESGNYLFTSVPKEAITELADKTVSLARVLNSVSYSSGASGKKNPESFAFMKQADSGLYLLPEGYFEASELSGKDEYAPSLIIPETTARAGDYVMQFVTYNGQKYIGTSFKKGEDEIYYCTNLRSTITSSFSTLFVIGLFFLALIILSALYIFYIRQFQKKVIHDSTYSDDVIHRKERLIALTGIAAAGLFVYYAQTLFSLSASVMNDGAKLNRLRDLYEMSEVNSRLLREDYEKEYTSNAYHAAKLLANHPEIVSSSELKNLSRILHFDYFVLFDPEGKEILSDGPYQSFIITNKNDQFLSGMERLYQGYPSTIFNLPDEINSGWEEGYQQKGLGVPLISKEGELKGYLLGSFWPQEGNVSDLSVNLGSIAANEMQENFSIFLIADPEKQTIVTFNGAYQNQPVSVLGLSGDMLSDSYFGKLKINGITYYATSTNIHGLYAYVLTEYREIYSDRVPVSLLSALLYALSITVLLHIMRPKRKGYDEVIYGSDSFDKPSERMTMVETDNGIRKSTIASSYRMNTLRLDADATPEERIAHLIGIAMVIAAFFLLGFYYVSKYRKNDASLLVNILHGNFSRGLNVFAVTRCLFIILAGFITIFTVRSILRRIIRISGPRGETICRLLHSTTEYIAVIIVVYLCLSNLGVDTGTLLASLGLGSLIIGMGARELITDILAGLFIIFEGDFRVGDIININGYTGMVQEIGLRTTKVSGWDKNVKILNNRNMTNVINMTKRNSFAVIQFSVPGSTEIELLEKIFAEEFKDYKNKYPELIDVPKFMGIKAFQGSSYECRVIAEVGELDRGRMEYELSKDIKQLLRKNGIQNY